MPMYCYVAEDGEVVEMFRNIEDRDRDVTIAGKTYVRHLRSEWGTRSRNAGGWPLVLDFHKVHKSQAKQLQQRLWDHGCRAEVRGDGTPVVNDPGEYRKYQKVVGLVDMS